MAKATIPLAQSKFNIKALDFPVLVSRKFDGVPIRIDVVQEYEGDFSVSVRSRQGKPVVSTDWNVQALIDELMENGLDLTHPTTIIAEVTPHDLYGLQRHLRRGASAGATAEPDPEHLRLHAVRAHSGSLWRPYADHR